MTKLGMTSYLISALISEHLGNVSSERTDVLEKLSTTPIARRYFSVLLAESHNNICPAYNVLATAIRYHLGINPTPGSQPVPAVPAVSITSGAGIIPAHCKPTGSRMSTLIYFGSEKTAKPSPR